MTPEDEYRAAHPDKIRMYDVRIDAFRDVERSDLRRIAELCFLYSIPAKPVKTQQDFDALYDKLARHAHTELEPPI